VISSQGADPNAQEGRFANALQAACTMNSQSHTGIAKGADVNIQGGGFGNALEAA
ncbi:hypothetical protein CERZMDRAFT_13394, partial [Cercospora zeae-maydis SCOH1-5]